MNTADCQDLSRAYKKRDIPFKGMSLLLVTVLIRTGSK